MFLKQFACMKSFLKCYILNPVCKYYQLRAFVIKIILHLNIILLKFPMALCDTTPPYLWI